MGHRYLLEKSKTARIRIFGWFNWIPQPMRHTGRSGRITGGRERDEEEEEERVLLSMTRIPRENSAAAIPNES